jgi:hypothetical protein
MAQNTSWEAFSYSAIQEIPRTLWNPTFRCRMYTTASQMIQNLSQTNPVHSLPSISILFSHVQDFISEAVSFLRVFSPKPCMQFSHYHAFHMTVPSHRPFMQCSHASGSLQYIIKIFLFRPHSLPFIALLTTAGKILPTASLWNVQQMRQGTSGFINVFQVYPSMFRQVVAIFRGS